VNREIHVAIWSYTPELGSDIMNYGQASIVKLGLSEFPRLLISHHGVELVHRGDQGKLRVLQHLGVPAALVSQKAKSAVSEKDIPSR
jgi:hypothetical protein